MLPSITTHAQALDLAGRLQAGLNVISARNTFEQLQLQKLATTRPLSPMELEKLDNGLNAIDEHLLVDAFKEWINEQAWEKEDVICSDKLLELGAIETWRNLETAASEHSERQALIASSAKKRARPPSSQGSHANVPMPPASCLSSTPSRLAPTSSTASSPSTALSLTLQQKVDVLDFLHAHGDNQSATARHFSDLWKVKLHQSRISTFVRQEAKIRADFAIAQPHAKRIRTSEWPAAQRALDMYFEQAEQAELKFNGTMIHEKWVEICKAMDLPERAHGGGSSGWLRSVKKRNGLKWRVQHGEAASASPSTIEEDRERLSTIASSYHLDDIFNMDETGLFWGQVMVIMLGSPPDRSLALHHHHGLRTLKTRVTYVLAVNASGTERLPPLIIGRSRAPRCFNKRSPLSLGIHYETQHKAWMDAAIFGRWIRQLDNRMRAEGRKILLTLDNFAGHEVPEGITNIQAVFFAPNLTSHVQPLDAGIIAAFKAQYRNQFCRRALRRFDLGKRGSDCYKLSLLEAIRMANAAWYEGVTTETIQRCFVKAGWLGKNDKHGDGGPTQTINNEELAEVQELLAQLDLAEENLLIHREERLSLSDLLNPADEHAQARRILSLSEIIDLCQEDGEETDQEDGDMEPELEGKQPTRDQKIEACLLVKHLLSERASTRASQAEREVGAVLHGLRIERQKSLQDGDITAFLL